jgi:hypothetical protein
MNWRQRGSLWLLEPPAARGLIQFIGGSYLAATPQLSYRRLLEALARQGLAIQAWSYVPGFDHQAQANEAWKLFRAARPEGLPALRLGHSLGCKLHLLAPDGGRASALVALSFNNFSAERSVPLLAEMGQQFGFRSEFSPSPAATLIQVQQAYVQPRNLLVRFAADRIDQSARLFDSLRSRTDDRSELVELPGDHLSPASGGLRRQLLGSWADDPARGRRITHLAGLINRWAGRD